MCFINSLFFCHNIHSATDFFSFFRNCSVLLQLQVKILYKPSLILDFSLLIPGFTAIPEDAFKIIINNFHSTYLIIFFGSDIPRSASRYQLGGIFNIIETGRSRICEKTVLLIDFAQYNITGISAVKGYEMIDRSKRDLPY